ncbi:FUSC family protein [Psychromonas sp. psych-6C06]|uniref:FUSC family protein n=1 Tax=Psychromonas sp. psych-6C06 TaxID=2058089 RepID=UPI000C3356BA|nr:FUSC family protein [Psychromonas sp. psych-6C06]PKF61575.1 FUSC family protein [Psychromonas sp. psych-6C06]
MLSRSSKEAIKIALAIVLALCIAIWFQWEKPYWAGIAVAVMAVNETFAHSLQKGRKRFIGALIGFIYAVFLISLFAQDRFLFISFYTILLALSLFMASDEKYGYLFIQSYTVCTILCCMGGFDGAYTFHVIVLRLQETVLGIVVFSCVYKLLWPISTESIFVRQYEALHLTIKQALSDFNNGKLTTGDIEKIQQNTNKLEHLLMLPNNGSYNLQLQHHQWQQRLNEINVIAYLLSKEQNKTQQSKNYLPEIERNVSNDDSVIATQTLLPADLLDIVPVNAKDKPFSYHRTFKQHIKDDALKVSQGVCTFIASVYFWIYLPVPGGYVFPMMAGIFATNLPPLPISVIRDIFWSIIGLGSFYLAQYLLLMPSFTELWQLAAFYFINIVAIWKVFDSARLLIFRVVGVNLLLVLSSGALNLTPSFSFSIPIMMVVYLLTILLIAKTFSSLFHPRESYSITK